MKTPLGTEVDIGAGHIALDGSPALRERGTVPRPPLLGPCLLWPRSPISATAELLLNQGIGLPQCLILHEVVSYSFVQNDILLVSTTPTSLNGGQPNFARCLALSWADTLYIYFRRLLSPNGILPGAKFTLRPSVAFCYTGSVTVRHSSSGRQPKFAAWDKEGNYGTFGSRLLHLYSTGRPLRWASTHVLVLTVLSPYHGF